MKVRELCTVAKTAYFHQKILECSGDQKALYSMANRLMFKRKCAALPSHTNSSDLAQSFAGYFEQKIVTIRDEISASQQNESTGEPTPTTQPSSAQPPLLDSFKNVTENEMRKMINESNSKHCPLDPIPTSLLKSSLDALLPIICKIVNTSLQSSTVPEVFKRAIVAPLLKKPSLDSENMKNYRPVSNLPYVSKLMEKVVMSRFNAHLDTHELREPLQSAYRAQHSTETALTKVFSDILCTIDNRQCVLLVLLDFSAAFDTIDHDIMLSRLENLFGVSGEALSWLRSYFSGRSQRVVLNGGSSEPVQLSTGVPQGSVAGPGTFPAYTQPVGNIARSHGVNLHLYADDTQLYVGCHLPNQEMTKQRMETCVSEVREWMANNMLKLNDSKTEYMIIGSRHTIGKIPDIMKSIEIGKDNIAMTSSARNIGVLMDSTLCMEAQVSSICRGCYLGIRDISRIRRYLTEDATTHLIIAYVMSKLDCNNALLYKIRQALTTKLQVVQNNAARVIAKKKSYQSIREKRKDLHWLPVEYRIKYKINLMTYKCLHNLAPCYLSDLLQYKVPARNNMRSTEQHLLKENAPKTVAGDRAFANAAPVLWNQLPQDLRETNILSAFKTGLKTHLFKLAFKVKT